MVAKIFRYFFLSLIFTSVIIFPQTEKKISQKQKELSKIKNEIDDLENQIRKKTKKERETYAVLDNYNQQNFLLNKLINSLKSEEKKANGQISLDEKKISNLEKDIKELRENYSRYVVSVYKYGKVDPLTSLFDAESVGQAVRRYKYLQKFSDRRQDDLTKLKNKINDLNIAKAELINVKKTKAQLAVQKQGEEKDLLVKLKRKKELIERIKGDKDELKAELTAKRDAESEIKDLISRLIEEERLAKQKLLAKSKSGKTITDEGLTTAGEDENTSLTYDVDLSTEDFASFSALKGRLNWPVKGGRVIRKYGENRNSKLNTVTLNYGVDIKVSESEEVKAVADGVVSALQYIPGYGSVIIITHKGDYRTVYSHLSEIYVNEGDRVRLGRLIGKVGESLEGYILHFEIWNSRDNQNPEVWLVKR
jgi:murein hydrolase activator